MVKGKDILGNLGQRLGFVTKTKHNKKIVWIHAVSVGEVLSIQYLINDIKRNNPETCCYVTVGTITGRQIAEKNLNADYISFIPYDFLPCMLLAFWRIKPSSIITVEAEIWPNFLILSSFLKIKKTLINARISTRSYNKYKTLKYFFAPIFNSFQIILTQSDFDTKRFLTIGVNPQILSTLGDIKAYNVVQKRKAYRSSRACRGNHERVHHTARPDIAHPAEFERPTYQVILVGSIHPGELDYYLKLFRELKKTITELRLIIAPRHLTWLDELETKIKAANFTYTMWTDENLAQALKNNFKNSEIICLCKLGELFNLYQFADIFYLGGTFVNVGGHNLLEPAAWAKPCIIGPHHQNTKNNADEMANIGGLIKVKNYDELLAASQRLLTDESLRLKMGNANLQWIQNTADKINRNINSI